MEIYLTEKSCRICLNSCGEISLFFENGEDNAAEMISSLFNVDVICDVNLPDCICLICMDSLKNARQIKKNVIDSEIMFKTYLELNNTILEVPENNMQPDKNINHSKPQLVRLDVEKLQIEKYEDSLQESDDTSTQPMNKIDDSQEYSTIPFNLPKHYHCDHCEFKTDTYKLLIYHMQTHPKIKMYECERCGKEFNTRANCVKHVSIHHNIKIHKCSVCDKEFKSRSKLKQHQVIHNTERNIPCPNCDKRFCHLKGLRAHLLTHNDKNVVCDVCGKGFKHTTFLKHHIATSNCHTPGRSRSYRKKNSDTDNTQVPCELCGKLLSINALKCHIDNIHFGKKRFSCSYCDKSFYSSGSFNHHMQYHINSNKLNLDPEIIDSYLKYKCDLCDKSFTSSFFLKNHKISHSDSNEHACSYCGKKFAFKYYVDRHVRLVHDPTNPRNFICKICGKVSADSSGLKSHMVAHTGETPFHCKFCDSKFRYLKSLRSHLKNKHKSNS